MTQEPPSSGPTPPGPPLPEPRINPYDPTVAPAYGSQYEQPQQSPYGQSYPEPYGQQAPQGGPYFAPGEYHSGAYDSRALGRRVSRPGTVTAAAVIAIVMSGLSGLVALLATLAAGSIAAELGLEDVGGAIVVVGVIYAAICVVAIVAAARTIAGSQPWRITLVVLASITALLSALSVLGSLVEGEASGVVIQFLWGGGAVLCIVFLFAGNANAYFNQRN